MPAPDTTLLDALLAGLSDRNAASCLLRKAQQAAYAPEQYAKSVRTSLFPTYIDLPNAMRLSELWEACGLPVSDGREESSMAQGTNYLDPKTNLMHIMTAQKTVIESTDPPKVYTYAKEGDYCLLQDAINAFLNLVDVIAGSTELKELAFELTTGATAPPPSLVASLQNARNKLSRLEKFKETLSRYRTAAADLEAVLECVPRIEPLVVPLPDSGTL